jgi:hypothetical protein
VPLSLKISVFASCAFPLTQPKSVAVVDGATQEADGRLELRIEDFAKNKKYKK